MNNIHRYYSELYGRVSDMYVSVNSFDRERPLQRFCKAEELPALIEELSRSTRTNLFHTFGVFTKPPEQGRGSSKDIDATVAVYLDIDLGDCGLYADGKNPATTLPEIKDRLASWGLPEPSGIVSTGNGFHFEYRLTEPLFYLDDETRGRGAAMLKGFLGFAIEKGREIGWKLDNVADLSRAKRALGSWNFKDREKPKPVELIEYNPRRTYSLAELEAFKPAPRHHPDRPARTTASGSKAERLPQWGPIAQHCPFVQDCMKRLDSLSYGEWFTLLGIAARCENGEAIAHDLSKRDARYTTAETETKIREVLKADGPATYAHIRDDLGFGQVVDGDILASRMHSPIQFGYASEALIGILKTTVYDLSSERFYDLRTLRAQSHKAFDMAAGALLPNPVAAFKTSRLAIKAARADYLPGRPLLTGGEPDLVLNVYRPPALRPSEGACDTILAHFDYLVPDDDERAQVLDYLAFMVQQPGVKLTTALMFVGGQGNGKSTVARIMTEVLGASNVKTLPADAIGNRFQADRTNIQLLIFNEVYGIGRSEANALKSWVTEDEMEVEEKGSARHRARTPRGVLLISNHIDGLSLEESDRRYRVIRTNLERPDEDYFERLNAALKSELPSFAFWLGQRDLAGFNPHAPAKDSPLKAEMTRLSRSALEQAILDAMDAEDGCFRRDFFTTQEVISTVKGRGWEGRMIQPSTAGVLLGRLNFLQLPQQRVTGLGKARFWVWRNQDRWSRADPQEVSDHYRSSMSPVNDNVAIQAAA
jgi:hypothetical protein